MKFKLPRNIISNNVIKNVLYLITLVLAVSYIINEQNLALMSLVLIASGVYIMNKSVVIALFISIIATNLLLSMNYLKEFDVIEGMKGKTQQQKQAEQKKKTRRRRTKKSRTKKKKRRTEKTSKSTSKSTRNS